MTNLELLETFRRTAELSEDCLTNYTGSLKDAIAYFRKPDGRELPLREWTKDGMWKYLLYVRSNYCASFRTAPYRPQDAVCRQRVWVGMLPAADALKGPCVGCEKFKKPSVGHRVNALSTFFRYLARIGAVPVNFMADVAREYWEENPNEDDEEKRRNPTVEEMVRLVNGTAHPMKRAFYAASAKWWFRPNEMLALDRFASFGVKPPEGVPTPPGYEDAFRKYPDVPGFDQGGDMVYVPKKKGKRDKRKGNRWMVVDRELRPILEQYLAYWERTVKRDAQGRPKTTKLWITTRGTPLTKAQLERTMFEADCLRLGLMQEGDKQDPLRSWTAHCQRHFGEKVLELHDVPGDWCHHFRGDRTGGARKSYYRPTPEQVQQKYHQWVPMFGFSPLPDAPAVAGRGESEAETHRRILKAEAERARRMKRGQIKTPCVFIRGEGREWIVPRRMAAAFLYGLRAQHPGKDFTLRPETGQPRGGRNVPKACIAELCDAGLRMLA